MKRIMAFAIDFFIFLIFYVIIDFFCLFLSLKTDSYLMNNNYIFVFGLLHYVSMHQPRRCHMIGGWELVLTKRINL